VGYYGKEGITANSILHGDQLTDIVSMYEITMLWIK